MNWWILHDTASDLGDNYKHQWFGRDPPKIKLVGAGQKLNFERVNFLLAAADKLRVDTLVPLMLAPQQFIFRAFCRIDINLLSNVTIIFVAMQGSPDTIFKATTRLFAT